MEEFDMVQHETTYWGHNILSPPYRQVNPLHIKHIKLFKHNILNINILMTP